MKRCMVAMAFVCAFGLGEAQAPFTIVRPLDGAKVREKVVVRIPKNSIPSGGYLGISLNGKFTEALLPPLNGKYYEYTIDTKGRGIADGPLKIEAQLFVEFEERPRIVDRSSVDVTVANRSAVPGGTGARTLRYKFTPGTADSYRYISRSSFSTLTANQRNNPGGRVAEMEDDDPTEFRMVYEVDRRSPDGGALVRIIPQPPKGQNYAYLEVNGSQGKQPYASTDMQPLYMQVSNTGTEIFGSIPSYFGFEGLGSPNRLDLIASPAFPTLPARAVAPGSAWQTRFQLPNIDLDRRYDTYKITTSIPARGELLGYEWEMGHPCAKIRNTISEGNSLLKNRTVRMEGQTLNEGSIAVEEIVYFALDLGKFIKIDRTITLEGKLAQPQQQAGFGGAPGVPGAGGAPGGLGLPGRGGAGGGRGQDDDLRMGPGILGSLNNLPANFLQARPGGVPGGPPGGFGGPGGPPGGFGRPGQGGGPFGGFGGGAGRNANNRGTAAQAAEFFRIRLNQLYILQK